MKKLKALTCFLAVMLLSSTFSMAASAEAQGAKLKLRLMETTGHSYTYCHHDYYQGHGDDEFAWQRRHRSL